MAFNKTERVEKLNNIIDETQAEINEVEVTIQKLNTIKDENTNEIIIQEIDKSINSLKTQKEFLEQIKEDDSNHRDLLKTEVL